VTLVFRRRTQIFLLTYLLTCPDVSFPRMRDLAHQNVSFLGGSCNYSQGPWTDFDEKYAKTRGSARMCLFWVANIKCHI